MPRLLHIAGKDIRIWMRDVTALGILLGMPLVLIFILGSALGGGGQDFRIPVAVVNLDRGAATPALPGEMSPRHVPWQNIGDDLVETLRGSERIDEVFDVSYGSAEVERRRDEVASGERAAVLVIPRDFTEKVQAGEPVELEVLTDPGAELSAGIWTSVVRSFAAEYSAASIAVQTTLDAAGRYLPEGAGQPGAVARLQQAAVAAATDDRARPITVKDAEADVELEMTALDYYAVSMTSMFLMFGAMFGAFSTIKERREQTLSRLLSTPTRAVDVTGGKMLGIFVLGMLQFCVLFLATRFIFGVEWGADIGAIFAIAAAEMLAVTGLAVLIASLARTERGAGGLGPLIIQIQALLGGAFFTITILPEWLQPIRYASVVGWSLEGWHTVQSGGGGLADVIGPVSALLAFAAVFLGAGALLTGVRR